MKYHLIGNKGISMSAIADLLVQQGHTVTGSDLKSGGHSRENIDTSIDRVIRTSAVNNDSPGWVEVQEAQRLGIPVIKRSELLGEITNNYELIAISGMHGKTTTTALAGLTLIAAGLDPTVLVGEHLQEFDGQCLRLGKSKYFVMEACEYDRSFLDFAPQILILTNIEEEHLDTYPGGLPEIIEAFSLYIAGVRQGGVIIANRGDNNIRRLLEGARSDIKIIWYGQDSTAYQDLPYDLSLPGEHNRSNALAVLALADYLHIEHRYCQQVFSNFKGAKRRLEYWGELNQALLYDDYGHHPTEIKATLKAMKEKYPDYQLVVIFWPHQYKRIKALFVDFANAFSLADQVYIKEIYFVPGRDEVLDVSAKQLAEAISEHGVSARDFKENSDIHDALIELSGRKSIFLTIGIPPIYKMWEETIGE